MKVDGFLVAMVAAVALAVAAPWVGASGGPLHLDLVTKFGIALVFFMHGAALAPAALRAGAANWRLHLLVHGSTFILFPALGLAIFVLSGTALAHEVRVGIFYLCALPSTISSSVAMTSLGRGNVPGAIFNATLSGLLGMVLTPLLVALVVGTGAAHLPLLPAILDVAKTLLLPFAIGQLARPWVGGFIVRNKRWTTRLDRSVILLIVYGAFCQSTADGLWRHYDVGTILTIGAIVLLLLAIALTATAAAARLLGFSREDEVAAVFCGSKKSLANGAPIAAILFGQSSALGIILLPLMLYHQAQLFVCSILARRYAIRAEIEERAKVEEQAGAEQRAGRAA